MLAILETEIITTAQSNPIQVKFPMLTIGLHHVTFSEMEQPRFLPQPRLQKPVQRD